jgi:hypothetical protein
MWKPGRGATKRGAGTRPRGERCSVNQTVIGPGLDTSGQNQEGTEAVPGTFISAHFPKQDRELKRAASCSPLGGYACYEGRFVISHLLA